MRQGILVSSSLINFILQGDQNELNVLANGAQGIKFLSSRGSFYGGTVNSNGNMMDGILLQHNSAVVKGTEGFPFSAGVINTNMNGANGIQVTSGSDIASDPELTVLTSENNTLSGLRLDDGRATLGGSALSGNGMADVEMVFQSKLTLEGNNSVENFVIEAGSICRDLSEPALCPTP